jgi:NAD(P)-dependent dehydrogenase (short-subunit alcohol dehydrogenase family)
MPDLSDRVSVVVGAGRGFGRAVALSLSKQGSRLVLASRTQSELAETQRLIADSTGHQPLAIAVDVSEPEQVDLLRDEVRRAFGPVQILVNSAATFGPVADVASVDAHEWLQTLAVNAMGPFLTCRAFVAGMVGSGWGRVINVSASVCFMPPDPGISAYVTSKVALNQLTRHLAAELAGTGVTANAIHPGVFKSAMWLDIKTKAQAIPGETRLTSWAARVEESGGEPYEKGVDLVNRILRDGDTNGRFLWPESSWDAPLPTW